MSEIGKLKTDYCKVCERKRYEDYFYRRVAMPQTSEHYQAIKALLFGIVFFVVALPWASAYEISLPIIAEIESGGNPSAYNPKSKAMGLYQITPICLEDYNNAHPGSEIPLNTLMESTANGKVASWYFKRIEDMLRHYGLETSLENILTAYNCGIKCVIDGKMPSETSNYIAKYRRLSNGV